MKYYELIYKPLKGSKIVLAIEINEQDAKAKLDKIRDITLLDFWQDVIMVEKEM